MVDITIVNGIINQLIARGAPPCGNIMEYMQDLEMYTVMAMAMSSNLFNWFGDFYGIINSIDGVLSIMSFW